MVHQYSFDEALTGFAPSAAGGKPPSYIKDHRQRLRARFAQGGDAAVADYELLELVLFRAIPRQDVKPLAHKLLATLGDFSGVVSAPRERLSQVSGVGDAVITELKIVEAAAHRLARVRVIDRQAISGWDALVAYCRTAMAHRDTEHFRILFLDRKNGLIADEVQQTGTVDHTPVYPREVIRRALEHSATALILVHNHPSGDPTPSRADIQMTKKIIEVAAPLGIEVHDHVIIGLRNNVSLRGLQLI